MRVFCMAALIALVAGPAYAQKAVPRYGDINKDRTPAEIAQEKSDENARDTKVAIDINRNECADRGSPLPPAENDGRIAPVHDQLLRHAPAASWLRVEIASQ